MLTFGSLFAGIGGFDLGLERAGMTVRWQVEIDDYCTRVLAKHWPDIPRFRDVRECGAATLEPVDLVCGGFPCQPFSVAGKQRGHGDDRHLWPEMFRIIAELRPRWVLAENVPGIVRMALDTVLLDLENLGYTTGSVVIPACALDAPHRRDRVWIVAHADGGRCQQCNTGQRCIPKLNESGADVADADSPRQCQPEGIVPELWRWPGDGSKDVPDTQHNPVLSDQFDGEGDTDIGGTGWWAIEPDMGRVADGIPHRVDRLRCLGNAVVPRVAEVLGRMILEVT